MNKLTFRECRKYIEALKQKEFLLGIKGHEVKKYLQEQEMGDKVLIAISKKQRLILVSTEEGFLAFHFLENDFERMEILASLDAYQQESYNFSVFQINVKRLLTYLKADEKLLVTLHASIHFELGFRLLKKFLDSSNVSAVIYYWASGPMLLCYRENNQNFYCLSEARSNIHDEEALEKVRIQCKNIPCTMKILRLSATNEGNLEKDLHEEEMMFVDLDARSTEKVDRKLVLAELPTDSTDQESGVSSHAEKPPILSLPNFDDEEALFFGQEPEPKPTQEQKPQVQPEPSEPSAESSMEDSVLVSNKELPELDTKDVAIFQKYGIAPPPNVKKDTERLFTVEETKKTPSEAEKPDALKEQEKAILEQYGVPMSDVSSAPKPMINLEESVVFSDKELPSVGPSDVSILKKYGIDRLDQDLSKATAIREALPLKRDTARLEKASDPTQDVLANKKITGRHKVVTGRHAAMVDPNRPAATPAKKTEKEAELPEVKPSLVTQQDLQILVKYGIRPPRGLKSTLEEVREAYQLAVALKKLPEHVAYMDRVVFVKFGLAIPSKPIFQRINYTYVVVPLLVFLFIYLGYQAASFYKHKKLKQEKITAFSLSLNKLRSYQKELTEKMQVFQSMLKNLEANFPPNQGYPEPNPSMLEKIAEIKKHIAFLEEVIETSERYLQKDLNLAIEYLPAEKFAQATKPYYGEQMENMRSRLETALATATFMHKKELEQKELRSTCRLIRENVVGMEQKLKTLEENWRVLQTKYPEDKGFPPRPAGAGDLLKDTKNQVKKIRKDLKDLEIAMLSDDPQALTLAKPYQEQGEMDFSKLEGMNESIQDVIQSCESILEKRNFQRQITQSQMALRDMADSYQKELDAISQASEALDAFPADLNIPRPHVKEKDFLAAMQKDFKELEEASQAAARFMNQGNWQEAEKSMQPLQNKNYSLARLTQLKGNLQDALRIAKSMQKSTELGKEIAMLLEVTKGKLFTMEQALESVDQQILLLNQNYSLKQGFPPIEEKYTSLVSKSKATQANLKQTIETAENFLDQKALEQALAGLQKSHPQTVECETLVPDLTQAKQDLSLRITEYKKIDAERKQIAEINEKVQKIKGYQKELEEQLRPLEANLKTFQENFAGAEGYPALPQEVAATFTKGKATSEKVSALLAKNDQLLYKKEYDGALQNLQSQEATLLINRNMITELSKYRYRVEDLLFESTTVKERKGKIGRIKQILEKLYERTNILKKTIPEFTQTLASLQRDYPAQKGFLPVDPNLESALKEAQLEVAELTQAIEKGEDHLHSGRYEDAIKLIGIYDNPAVTKVNYVLHMVKKAQETLSDNQRIANDKDFRMKIEKEREAERERLALRKKWATSPGAWYDRVKVILKIYEEIEENLRKSLKGADGAILYPKVRSEIKRLEEIPDSIAELEENIHKIAQQGKDLEKLLAEREEKAIIPKVAKEARLTRDYLLQRKLEIDAEEHIQQLETVLQNLKRDLTGPHKVEWVESERLREINRAVQGILRKYDDSYRPVNSVLINFSH